MSATMIAIAIVGATVAGAVGGFKVGQRFESKETDELRVALAESETELAEERGRAQALAVTGDTYNELLQTATRDAVAEVEIRQALAATPIQCRRELGGDPAAIQCQWATCLQYNTSDGQRPDCDEVESQMLAFFDSLGAEESLYPEVPSE